MRRRVDQAGTALPQFDGDVARGSLAAGARGTATSSGKRAPAGSCNPASSGKSQQRSQEQSRAQYLTRAHEALSSGRYVEALRLLESCQKEGISSPEIAELMDFARQEADQSAQEQPSPGIAQTGAGVDDTGILSRCRRIAHSGRRGTGSGFPSFSAGRCSQTLQSLQREIDGLAANRRVLSTQEQYAEAHQVSGIAATVGSTFRVRFRLP